MQASPAPFFTPGTGLLGIPRASPSDMSSYRWETGAWRLWMTISASRIRMARRRNSTRLRGTSLMARRQRTMRGQGPSDLPQASPLAIDSYRSANSESVTLMDSISPLPTSPASLVEPLSSCTHIGAGVAPSTSTCTWHSVGHIHIEYMWA